MSKLAIFSVELICTKQENPSTTLGDHDIRGALKLVPSPETWNCKVARVGWPNGSISLPHELGGTLFYSTLFLKNMH